LSVPGNRWLMAGLIRANSAIDIPARHVELVFSVAHGEMSARAGDRVSASWQRSAMTYRLDPASSLAPRILTAGEVRERPDPLDELIAGAQQEIDRLYKVVQEAGYVLLLCDTGGVAVDHRGDDRRTAEFKYWGTCRRRVVRGGRGHKRHRHLHR